MSADKSVTARIISILWSLSESGVALSLKEIASYTGLPPPTVHRLLSQLVRLGMVARTSGRSYRIGSELLLLSAQIGEQAKLTETARPILDDVAQRAKGACLFSLYLAAKRSRVALAKAELDEAPGLAPRLYEQKSLVWGAGGRAILAHIHRNEICSIVASAPPGPLTGGAVHTPTLMRQLADVRAKGYALSCGEIQDDTVALSAPVFGPEKKVFGHLALLKPRRDWTDASERAMSLLVSQRAAELSARLARGRAGPQSHLLS